MAAIHSDEFKRDAVRIALTSGLTRRQVASDLGIGLSTLGKWVRAVSEEAKVPAQDSATRAVPARSSSQTTSERNKPAGPARSYPPASSPLRPLPRNERSDRTSGGSKLDADTPP